MNEEQNLAKPAQQAAGKNVSLQKGRTWKTPAAEKQALAQRTRVIEQQKAKLRKLLPAKPGKSMR